MSFSPDGQGSADRRCFSSWLRPISRQSSYESLWSAVQELGLIINSSASGLIDAESESADPIDPWEKSFGLNWLTRLLSFTVDRLSNVGDSQHDWESLYSLVGHAMAQLTESSASSSLRFLQRTYVFELLLREACRGDLVEIQLREGSPSYLAIGSQTWNSAPLLCRRLSGEPFEFFPQLLGPFAMSRGHPGEQGSSHPNLKASHISLKVLELGSGTGLVGLTASHIIASILRSLSPLVSIDVQVILTDYHPEVLANLQHNLELNQAGLKLPEKCLSSLKVDVMQLDWRKLKSSELTRVGLEGSFDVILGSDLVYEPEHAIWASNAVQHFLKPGKIPLAKSSCTLGTEHEFSSPNFQPLFHLLLPLRPTFTKESEAVHYAFGGSNIELLLDQTHLLPSTLPTHSCKWELLTNSTVDEVHQEPPTTTSSLKITKYCREEGVKFGQGCGQYQYLQITWTH